MDINRILREYAPPLLLAAALAALYPLTPAGAGQFRIYLDRPELGSFLLAGLPTADIGLNLPLFGAAAAFARAAGAEAGLLLAVRFGLFCLVFAAGCLLRNRRAGLAAMLAAGALELSGAFSYDAEQSFYSFFLLLSLCALLLRSRADTYARAALAGLAVGASLLVRSPLLFFPPLAALWALLRPGGLRAPAVKRTLLFLCCAYVLLLPWGAMNYRLYGEFRLADPGRAAANLITAAKGAVYTMNGDPYRLAGLAPGDSAALFYLREAAANPASFALGVLKRLWAVLLFHPLLFLLLAAAAALGAWEDRFAAFALPLYLALVHALLSVESRYFYPLLYLAPPLLAAALFRKGAEAAAARQGTRLVLAAFAAAMLAASSASVLAAAYPARAERGGSFAAAAGSGGKDAVLRGLACREVWVREGGGKYGQCLGALAADFGGLHGYFYRVYNSARPASAVVPRGEELRAAVILALREFELGNKAGGAAALGRALALYGERHNMLRGAPYARDRAVEGELKGDSGAFWSDFVYPALLGWPPERAVKIAGGLSASAAPDGRLKLYLDALGEMARGSFGPGELRAWAAPQALGISPSSLRRLWRAGGEESGRLLAASRLEKPGSAGAEAGLLRALALEANPATAEIWMELCTLRSGGSGRLSALKACQAAAYASYFGAEGGPPEAGSEASLRSYRLLLALGRAAEAREALGRAVWNSPPSWPGLAGARELLEEKSF